MRVSHRGCDGLMPKELLNSSIVHPLHHPLACPKVAQVVKPEPFQACFLLGAIERSLKTMPGCAVLVADKDSRTSVQTSESRERLQCELG